MTVEAAQIERVTTLEQLCFEASAWSRSQVEGALARSGVILVHESDGYVVGEVVLDEVELHRIGVHPDARGLGRGRTLLRRFMRRAWEQGARALFLEVREDNAPARRLYTAAGLTVAGVRPRYYADGCAAVLYTGTVSEAAE